MTALHPLGDQGALAYFADENCALRFASTVRRIAPAWLVDVVQAYTSVAVFYDLAQTHFHNVELELHRIAAESPAASDELPSRLHRIPCCYEMGADLERISRHTGLSVEHVIRLHSGTEYTVYAIGFCPGFPYLGYLPPELCGVPRLETPRLRVEPGTVGLTGRQTGIYTEARPGGWNLLGRTPLELVHFADGYFPLRTGDRIRFDRIDEAAYAQLHGKRLPD